MVGGTWVPRYLGTGIPCSLEAATDDKNDKRREKQCTSSKKIQGNSAFSNNDKSYRLQHW